MGYIEYPNGLETAVDAIGDDDEAGFYQPNTNSGERKNKKNLMSVFRDYFENRIVNGLVALVGGILLKDGIKAFDELSSSSISGGSNLAKVAGIAGNKADANFKIVDAGGTTYCKAAITMSASAKTHQNTDIEILSQSGSPIVTSVKLGKSDTVDAAGAYLNVVLSGITDISIEKIGNNGNNAGWELMTPDQSTTLPGGGTASYLIAGEECQAVSPLTWINPKMTAYAAASTSLRIVLQLDYIAYLGTTVTFPSAFNFSQSDGTLIYAVSASETAPVDTVNGNTATCLITTTGLTSGKYGHAIGANSRAILS